MYAFKLWAKILLYTVLLVSVSYLFLTVEPKRDVPTTPNELFISSPLDMNVTVSK